MQWEVGVWWEGGVQWEYDVQWVRVSPFLGTVSLACVQCADVVFISPPWGGPGYSSSQVFDLHTMVPLDGVRVFQVAHSVTENIAYYVPRNVDVQQVSPSPAPPPSACGQCVCVSVRAVGSTGWPRGLSGGGAALHQQQTKDNDCVFWRAY